MQRKHPIHSQRFIRNSIHWSLSLCLVWTSAMPLALAGSTPVLSGDISLTVNPANIKASLPINGASRKVTMSLHGISIQDALRALAKKGGFNVLIDESVTGDISVDLNNVSIQDALETLKSSGNLAYSVSGSNLMVTSATSEKAASFRKSITQIFPLRNANATVVADILNNTLFADQTAAPGGGGGGATTAPTGGGGGQPVTADFHTNSLIVVGQPADIQSVAKHLQVLDQPRHSKTWRLSQANVLDVASILSASLFNEGIPLLNTGSGGSTTQTGTSVGGSSAPVRAVAENIQESTGTSQASQSGGGSGGGTATSLTNSLTLRAKVKAMQTIQVAASGPIILPDTRMNTLTIMGTAEQIAMAEAMIPTLDRKVPQVVLETSLVELSETSTRELGFNFGFNAGGFGFGSNNASRIGLPTNSSTPLENLVGWSSSPITRSREFYYQLNALITQNKAKMLANPTIITSSDNEAIVSIVDEVVRSVQLVRSALTEPTATVNIGEAGIVLNILPKVGADNTVSLRVRPVISTVADVRAGLGGTVTLLSRREVVSQNIRLQDGETFVLGGLVQNTNKEAIFKNPALANLPILGALARNSTHNKKRTELVVLITPHIINDDPGVAQNTPHKPGSGMVPATLSNGFSAKNSNLLPVSWSGDNRPNALPPLEKPHEFNSQNNSSDRPGESASLALPAPKPSGALLPDELTPATAVARHSDAHTVPVSYPGVTGNQSSEPARKEKKSVQHAVVQAPAEPDTSDEAIRAIMAKFK